MGIRGIGATKSPQVFLMETQKVYEMGTWSLEEATRLPRVAWRAISSRPEPTAPGESVLLLLPTPTFTPSWRNPPAPLGNLEPRRGL